MFKIICLQFIDVLGRIARQSISTTLELIFFTTTAIRRGFSFIHKDEHNGVIRNSIVTQIIFSGVDSLIPTLLVMSITVAFSVTAQLIITFQTFGSEKEVINLLIHFVAFELSPLLTAIILICRSGSAVAVDLGNMKINKEIRSLELLGVDVMVYLVFPRLLGISISQTALAVYFSTLSLVLGIFFSVFLESASNFKYFFILIESIAPLELVAFLVKNIFFGLIIGANACFHGLRVQVSVTEVPRETQQAIVHSLVMIFLLNALFIL
ncbi:MAG: ABC transporter permease [Methylococcaceae bacterium]|nr:ABC transporter permease [Methylococcaceae bacterium]